MYIRETEYIVTKREKAILKDGTICEFVYVYVNVKLIFLSVSTLYDYFSSVCKVS